MTDLISLPDCPDQVHYLDIAMIVSDYFAELNKVENRIAALKSKIKGLEAREDDLRADIAFLFGQTPEKSAAGTFQKYAETLGPTKATA